MAAIYVENLWQEGSSRQPAVEFAAALQDGVPAARRRLRPERVQRPGRGLHGGLRPRVLPRPRGPVRAVQGRVRPARRAPLRFVVLPRIN